jgi:hypothetical protein
MGYILNSVDRKKFSRFVEKPTTVQLVAFADCVSDLLDEYDRRFEAGDPVADWPSDPKELSEIVRERLARADWYGDLSDTAKELWERAVCGFGLSEKYLDHRQEGDADSVDWSVIDLARKHHKIKEGTIGKKVLSRFCECPFRFFPVLNRRRKRDAWRSNHSMHPPEEVVRLIDELTAARPTIEEFGDQYDIDALEDDLLPVLERIAEAGRMLHVYADT